MIHDLTLASQCTTLAEYYRKLCELQAQAHGADYLRVHVAIAELLDGCDSYVEFGVNQGTTLALAVLSGVPIVTGIDLDPSSYWPASRLFESAAVDRGVVLRVVRGNSLTCAPVGADVLYIDSLHKPWHLRAELERHADGVRRAIVCHDTKAPGMMGALNEFCNSTPWWLVTACDKGVGYAVMLRGSNRPRQTAPEGQGAILRANQLSGSATAENRAAGTTGAINPCAPMASS